MRILILGGTGEARDLAARLVGAGHDVVTSLAGRVSAPVLPVGGVREGGFGGVEGLRRHLAEGAVEVVVDATHPFAETITANAAAACRLAGLPLVRLQRPGWDRHPAAETFVWVDTAEGARTAAEARGIRPFVTTGRQGLAAFASWDDRYVLARVVDPPDWAVPDSWEVLRSRGPYTYAAERDLMAMRRIDVLLTKDSGGPMTEAKLAAATDLGASVVVIRRPPPPPGVPLVETVSDAVNAVDAVVSTRAQGPRREDGRPAHPSG